MFLFAGVRECVGFFYGLIYFFLEGKQCIIWKNGVRG